MFRFPLQVCCHRCVDYLSAKPFSFGLCLTHVRHSLQQIFHVIQYTFRAEGHEVTKHVSVAVFTFYHPWNNQELISLKQHPFLISQSEATSPTQLTLLWAHRWWEGTVPCWGVWGWVCFQAHSDCWQNPVLWGCRTEVSQFAGDTHIPWLGATFLQLAAPSTGRACPTLGVSPAPSPPAVL